MLCCGTPSIAHNNYIITFTLLIVIIIITIVIVSNFFYWNNIKKARCIFSETLGTYRYVTMNFAVS